MPLPYNGGYHETAAGTGRQCLPEIAAQGDFLIHFSVFIHFRARPYSELPGKAQKKLRSFDRSFMLALPIFPCSHPQSIVGANELNFCVRDGNRCTLTAINTNYLSVFRLLPENIHHYTTARLPCQALFW